MAERASDIGPQLEGMPRDPRARAVIHLGFEAVMKLVALGHMGQQSGLAVAKSFAERTDDELVKIYNVKILEVDGMRWRIE